MINVDSIEIKDTRIEDTKIDLESSSITLGEFIGNPNVAQDLLGKSVVGFIEKDKMQDEPLRGLDLLRIKNPSYRMVPGKLGKIRFNKQKPFTIRTPNGNYDCNFIREIHFVNKNIDSIINNVKSSVISQGVSWDDFKSQVVYH